MTFLARDYVRTAEGLIFAVVDQADGSERIPCFLRYRLSSNGKPEKLGTAAANTLLQQRYPKYLFHCDRRDADMHGVLPQDVIRHLRPRDRVRELLDPHQPLDPFEARTARLLKVVTEVGIPLSFIGVTGSVLAGCHRVDSDIDLVLYNVTAFERARELLPELINEGVLTALDDAGWDAAYQRRDCALTYEEFRWHESRKNNKAVFEGTKFDLSLAVERANHASVKRRKLGAIQLAAMVTEDRGSFDYPARLGIANHRISEVVAFTATYSGQARIGEQMEVSGLLEEDADGTQRIVVGSDREAHGHYIRVIHPSRDQV